MVAAANHYLIQDLCNGKVFKKNPCRARHAVQSVRLPVPAPAEGFLLLPMLARSLLLFSVRIMGCKHPSRLTLNGYSRIFHDPRFGRALLRTLALCAGSLLLGCLLGIPRPLYASIISRAGTNYRNA